MRFPDLDDERREYGASTSPGGIDTGRRHQTRGAEVVEIEEQIGYADPDWPDWYAQYIVQEHGGHETRPGASI
jgi:hypothetical protein